MLKKEKGITLIALIITIIVMLILVGVTVNVALNGGLFEKAEIAKTQTQREIEKEELTMIAIAAYDEKTRKIDQSELELGGKYSIVSNKTTEEKIVVTGQYGITWQIDVASGKIEEYTEDTRVPFTNYIERGNNYYINGDKTSDSYEVATFSEIGTFTVYQVNNGQVSEMQNLSNISFEIIDKNDIETKLGYTKEILEGAAEVEFSQIGDDTLVWDEMAVCLFKSNYEKVVIRNDWFTLDTSYQFPS